jgi:hypothetical protein
MFLSTARIAAHRSVLSALLGVGLLSCSRGSPAPSASSVTNAGVERPPAGGADAAPAGTLTAERRLRVFDAMLPAIRAHYVFPDLGAAAVLAVQDHQAHGDYDALSVEDDFARRLTDDLRAVTHDIHFRVRYRAPGTAPEAMTPERRAALEVEARQGVHSVERLADGVALLRLDSFLDPPDSPALQKAYADAMAKVADARVLVLDLRENYGGDPRTVAFMLSYLFDATPVHVNDIWSRDEDVTWQNWTQPNLPGRRFGGHKPIFVLVSRRTISGGEEAAYDLQAQKRALVLGEATAGGANPSPRVDLGDGFAVFIPSARAINPITHTNWEGTGVQPDVAVDPADALKTALSLAAAPD